MEEGWINKVIKQNMPTEESLKDISKPMLAHNLAMKEDELKVITEERDTLAKDNTQLDKDVSDYKLQVEQLKKEVSRLSEERDNFETLLKAKNKNEL